MSELITQAEYARRKDWSRPYVTQLVQAGRIKLIDGKIDPDQADADIEATAHPGHSKKSEAGAPKGVDYLKARTMKEAYNAQKAKLEFEQMAAKLVDREFVEKEGYDAGHATREALLYLPSKHARALAEISDPVQAEVYLEQMLTDALNKLTETTGDAYSAAAVG